MIGLVRVGVDDFVFDRAFFVLTEKRDRRALCATSFAVFPFVLFLRR